MIEILQPLLSYRFQVLFPNDVDSVLTQQIKQVDLDLINKRLYIEIRQPITSDVFETILDVIAYSSQTITIEPMSSNNEALWSIHFNNCKCIEHGSSFDYSLSDIFYHKLTFSFSRVVTSDPVDPDSSDSKNTEAEEILIYVETTKS